MMDYNKSISTIPYIVTERFIEKFELKTERLINYILLFPHKIETKSHTFQFEHVFDISYKNTSGNCGFLYLHTNQGAFMYIVEVDPSEFINAFKSLQS